MDPRMEKRVYNCVGAGPDDWSATPSLVRRFVRSGRLLLMELDGNNQVLRQIFQSCLAGTVFVGPPSQGALGSLLGANAATAT